jgi:cell division protein FtsX
VYLLKLSLRPWRLALLSQIFSSLAVGFLLLMMGFLFWMQQGLKSVLVRMQGEQVVTAYLNRNVSAHEEGTIVDSIHTALQEAPHVEVKLVSAKQFVATMKNQYPDLVRELEDLGQDMFQVVPRYVSVVGMLSDSALQEIQKIPGIELAESSKDRFHHIVGAFSTLLWIAKVLMGGVCFALLTGLVHLSRTNAYLHAEALSLFKLWGAGSTTLALPGTLSGLLVGVLGGAIACVGWMTVGAWLARHVRSLSVMLKGMPLLGLHLGLGLLLVGAFIGLLAGLLGSFSSAPSGKNAGGCAV